MNINGAVERGRINGVISENKRHQRNDGKKAARGSSYRKWQHQAASYQCNNGINMAWQQAYEKTAWHGSENIEKRKHHKQYHQQYVVPT